MGSNLDLALLRACGWLERADRALAGPRADAAAAAPSAPALLEAGALAAGRYRLKAVLGEGGMGRVWLAEDALDKRTVALKEMRAPRGDGPDLDLAFRREFYTMAKLQHPGTVQVFDYGQLPTGDRFIAMELVQGRDLSDLLRRGKLELATVYELLAQLAAVLGFIHSRLYVHCDIKSSNVRLTGRGALKLMDFGLMHQLGTPAGGALKGSAPYMAPEIPKGGVIDARTDLYSLGVLAFELATGRLPFTGKSLSELLGQHLHAAPPAMQPLREVPPEFEALVRRLLEKDPRARFQDAGELLRALEPLTGRAAAAPDYAARASYLHSADLIGREAEQRLLREALDETLAGRGRSLFVTAPAGVGKTRLLQEFKLAVKLAEVPFLTGHCRAEGQVPLAALAEALGELLAHCPRETLLRHGPALARMLPGLADRGVEPAPSRGAGADKVALLEGLRGLLAETADAQPFVLCLEDLHWADASTLELLNVAIRALAGKRAMVLGTLRSDEVDRFSLVFQTVDEGVTRRLELGPLTPGDTAALLAATLRTELPAAFAGRLQQATGGNAFFVSETLRALIEQGTLRLEGGRWALGAAEPLALPGSIAEAVALRLKALPEGPLALCRSLAPIGRVLDLRLIKAVDAREDEELFRALDELVERQFIQRVEQDYYFAHETVRQAVYAATGEAQRRETHQRLGEALERIHAGRLEPHAALLGFHFARGRDRDKAITWLRTAGERALASQLLFEGTKLLAESADLLEASERPQKERELLGVWPRLVESGAMAHPPTCAKYAEKLLTALAAKVEFPAGFKAFNAATASLVGRPGIFGRRKLERLWAEQPLDPDDRDPLHLMPKVFVYRNLQAWVLGVMGQTPRAMQILGEQLADNPQPGAFRAAAQIARSVGLVHTGQWEQQQREAREAIAWYEAHLAAVGAMPDRLWWYYASTYYWLVMGQANMGLEPDARAAERGAQISKERGYGDWGYFLGVAAMVRAALSGEPERLEALVGRLSDTVRRMGNPRVMETRLWMGLPDYYLQRGERELAEAAIAKLGQLTEALKDAWMRRYWLAYRARAAVDFAPPAEAQAALDAAFAAAKEAPSFVRMNQLRCAQAQLHLRQRQAAPARELAEQALGAATSPATANPSDEVLARRTLSEALPPGDGAAAAARESIELARRHGLKVQEALGQLALARACLASDRAAAGRATAEAEALLEALKGKPLLARAAEFRRRAAS